MKTLALVLTLVLTQTLKANTYEETMQQNITQLMQSTTVNDINQLAASFKRIALAETKQWLPTYYAAYAYTRATHFISEADSIDAQLDKAQAELDQLIKTHSSESEVHVLQALIYSIRITSPMRGYKYSTLSNESLAKAEQVDPQNARIYYCKGNNVYHTPKMFGGGQEKAKPLFEKASNLFNSTKNENPLWPSWGKRHNKLMLAKCLDTK